jgi:hypothetical protein
VSALLLDAAEHYAIDMGWPVFPLRAGGKTPATGHGYRDATTDRDQIRAWWLATPDANIGISCEHVIVLDVDTKNDALGRESLAALQADCGPLPETWRARTPSGGEHYYFAARHGKVAKRSIGVRPGLDLCGLGGYVVAPPSVTDVGRYEWTDHDELAACPAWVAALARVEPERPAAPSLDGRWGSDVMTRAERALRYVERMDAAVAGAGGHAALWRVAVALVRGFELPGAAALELLRVYSARCSPPWSERELAHKVAQAQRATVPSGYLLERGAA